MPLKAFCEIEDSQCALNFSSGYDMSGNMIAITDDTGEVAATFAYTPFGEVINSTINQPACNIPVGFAGQYGVLREPNGLYYMNARYYDPSIGRFLSEDPVGLRGGDLTLYSYAANNPVVYVDPSGLCGQSTTYFNEYTPDQQAVQDVVNGATNGGRKPLPVDDAETVLDWAGESQYPGARAKPGDVSDPSNWNGGGNTPHIHIPDAGRGGHVPVQPGVAPRPFPLPAPPTPQQATQMGMMGTMLMMGAILLLAF